MKQQGQVLIVGTGGHAKVVIELILAAGHYSIAGLIDPDATPRQVLGIPVVGTDADLPRFFNLGLTKAFVAIGENRTRSELGVKLRDIGFALINAISPAAVVSPSSRLGCGIAVMAGVVLNADVQIDDFAIINTRASVDHDSRVGEAAHIGPGATLAGNVSIGREAFLGVGTHVIPGIRIGEGALVGAGSCVVRDVPALALARGVPARIVKRHDTTT